MPTQLNDDQINPFGPMVWDGTKWIRMTTPIEVTGTVAAAAATTAVATTTQVVATGAVVWLGPTQTIAVNVSSIVPVTTQVSVSVSGVPVWFLSGATVAIVPGVSVNALVTGVVSVSAMPAISGPVSISAIAASQILGTIIAVSALSTIVNTIPVSVSHPAFSGVIASSVMATSVALGLPVWIVGGQTATGIPVLVTIASQTTVISGLVSVTGVSLSVVVSGAVSISAMPVVSATGVLVSILSTVLGTVLVTNVTQIPWMAVVTSTTPAISSTLLFSVWQGASRTAAGTTQFTIPAGKNLRVVAVTMVYAGSVALAVTAQLNLNIATVSASLLTASQVTAGKVAVLMVLLSGVATSTAGLQGPFGDVQAATTMGLFWQGTSITVQQIVITGFLF